MIACQARCSKLWLDRSCAHLILHAWFLLVRPQEEVLLSVLQHIGTQITSCMTETCCICMCVVRGSPAVRMHGSFFCAHQLCLLSPSVKQCILWMCNNRRVAVLQLEDLAQRTHELMGSESELRRELELARGREGDYLKRSAMFKRALTLLVRWPCPAFLVLLQAASV